MGRRWVNGGEVGEWGGGGLMGGRWVNGGKVGEWGGGG